MKHEEIKRKLLSIEKEVSELHPLLRELFKRMSNIQDVQYCHGPNEKGADFILTCKNCTGGIDYIGVIVKNGKVLSKDIGNIISQIDDCRELDRVVNNGKRKISMNQVWVVVNGGISQNVKDRIEAKKLLGITLVDIDDIAKWIMECEYQIDDDIPPKISICLGKQFSLAEKTESQSMAGEYSNDVFIKRNLQEMDITGYAQRVRKNQIKRQVSVENATDDNNIVFIYSEAGGDKTHMLLGLLKYYASNKQYRKTEAIPVYLLAEEINKKYDGEIKFAIDSFAEKN